jgi:hypothetical protein
VTFTTDQLSLILAAIAGLIALAALIWSFALQRRLNRIQSEASDLLGEGDAAGVSGMLRTQATALERTAAQTETLAGQVNQLLEITPRALQRVGIVRFNPFSDTGSDQSFAIALLDGQGDGLILSGLYSRGGVRIYAKPVAGGRSEYTLSDEEEQAIGRAMANWQG